MDNTPVTQNIETKTTQSIDDSKPVQDMDNPKIVQNVDTAPLAQNVDTAPLAQDVTTPSLPQHLLKFELNFAEPKYFSPDATIGCGSKCLPSGVFYSYMLSIIFQAGCKAYKNQYDGTAWAQSSLEVMQALEGVGCQFAISGMENITSLSEPCVFVGNHMSTLETFILPCLIQPHKDVTFIVKASLLKYPFFGAVLGARNPIVVQRNNPREDLSTVLEQGCKNLEAGRSVIVFPQSTRTPQFDPQQFNSIGIKLAKRAKVPFVPFALKTDAWGNGKLLKDFGKIDPTLTIHIAFAEPKRVQGAGKEEQAELVAYIQKQLKQWNS